MNNEIKMGGRGTCEYCNKMENNVSYHEVYECLKRSNIKDDGIELKNNYVVHFVKDNNIL